jgi:hypothetical protein
VKSAARRIELRPVAIGHGANCLSFSFALLGDRPYEVKGWCEFLLARDSKQI